MPASGTSSTLRQPPATGDARGVDLVRANLYRYLAVAVLPPDDERFGLLRDDGFRRVIEAALAWVRGDKRFWPASLGPGELPPASLATADLFPGGEALDEAYVAVFGHSISKDCPPHELDYYPNRDVTFRSQRLADVAGFYRAFGLDRARKARERVDHLSFEAEFLEIVIGRELYARDHDLGEEKVEVCREAQRRFFVEHLGWWLPAFGLRLAESTSHPFYRAVGRLVRGFVAVERASLGVPPFTELAVVQPDEYEPQGACFECARGGSLAGGEEAAAPAGGEK